MKPKAAYELYLVTDRSRLNGRSFIRVLEEAIIGGVSIVQLREKDTTSLEFYQLALQVRELTLKYDIPLIINDRLDIAMAVNADGVHVGQKDLPAKEVRRLLGDQLLLGVSVATLEEALEAQMAGADYIGVGALFPTHTKTDARKVTFEQVYNIKNSVNIPVVGIGGINEKNVDTVRDLGLDGIAVSSAILAADLVRYSADCLKKSFSHARK